MCADKGRADHTKPRPPARPRSQPGARTQAPLPPPPPRPWSPAASRVTTSSQEPATRPGPRRTAVTTGTKRSMAAPSSSLASSSHLSRRGTATAGAAAVVPSSPLQPQPQLLRHACSARRTQRVRCSWAGGRAASRRRTLGVCFVVSPSQPAGPCLWLLFLLGCVRAPVLDYYFFPRNVPGHVFQWRWIVRAEFGYVCLCRSCCDRRAGGEHS